MYSVKAVVLSHHRQSNGTYKVKVRLTKNRQVVYLPTSVIIHESELTNDLKPKSRAAKERFLELEKEIEEITAELATGRMMQMTVKELAEYVKKGLADKYFKLDFLQFGYDYAETQKLSTGSSIRSALHAIERYVGNDTLDISEINVRFLRGFEEYLVNAPNLSPLGGEPKKKSGRKVSLYLGIIKKLFGLAFLKYNEPDLGIMHIPVNPFNYYKVPAQPAVVHRDRDVEFVQKLINDRNSLKGAERKAVDMALMSFILMGTNIVDMWEAKPLEKGVFEYYRKKTRDKRSDKAMHRIYVGDRLEPFKEWLDDSGTHLFNYYKRHASYSSFLDGMRRALRSYADREGIPRFTSYTMRHTWATLAVSKQVGADPVIVDLCLVHKNPLAMGSIYMKTDWERLWEVNDKVLALFDWTPLEKNK